MRDLKNKKIERSSRRKNPRSYFSKPRLHKKKKKKKEKMAFYTPPKTKIATW